MTVAPFHSDPRILAFVEAFAATSVALAAGLALRRFAGRLLRKETPDGS